MRSLRSSTLFVRLSLAVLASGCNAVLGLNDLAVEETDAGNVPNYVGECKAHADCRRGAAGAGSAMVCIKPEERCVPLFTEDCLSATGDPTDDDAIILGSLFTLSGAQGATNQARQQSAALAVEEINEAGGIPTASGDKRALLLVSCNEAPDPVRAAQHLVDELHVPAIVGPNTSQDTLKVSEEVTVPGGTVVMTPTGVASSIADLDDEDLTWLMAPSDVQRAPLMISQINGLETRLKTERTKTQIKVGIVARGDALGIGTRTSLNQLVLNGKPLSDPINLGVNVQIDQYDFTRPDQAEIVAKYVDFAPDIMVLAGTAEAITNVMVPLERDWTAGDAARPHYVLIDSVKVPELLAAATDNDDLRHRVRGTGITPGPASAPVYSAFQVNYRLRYEGANATISGMGPSFDAVYAIAFALAATTDQPISGRSVARGLRELAGGETEILNQNTQILAAFQPLVEGEKITAFGTFAPLEWDQRGAVIGSTLEMWCIGAPTGAPAYQSSGLTFDTRTATEMGEYQQCAP
jgi:ABC-type branched-subunit amino acid transport system substrate-binding protein